MHSVQQKIKKIISDWKSKYIMMRELKKGYEKTHPQGLFHNYNQFLDAYDIISDTTSNTDKYYFIWLLRRKNEPIY